MAFPIDISTPSLSIDWNKCIKCYSCVRACDAQGPQCYIKPPTREIPMLSVNGEPVQIEAISSVKLSAEMVQTKCIGCGACATACPVGAITVRSEIDGAIEGLSVTAENPEKKASVALIAPSARVGLAECFGYEHGTFSEQGLVALLRAAGFTHVFDVQTGADLTTRVDAEELIEACKSISGSPDIEDALPVFTSCCPAWVALAETQEKYHRFLPHVSTARSCVAMAGALVRQRTVEALGQDYAREDLHIVDIMPCSAKKLERTRKALKCEINQCLTVVEAAEVIRRRLEPLGLTPEDITFENGMVSGKAAEIICGKKGVCDLFLSDTSGGAYTFGRAGGVAETVARFALRERGLLSENGIDQSTGEKLHIEWETVWESKDKLHCVREFQHPSLTIGSLAGTDDPRPAVIAHATGGLGVAEAMRLISEGNERGWVCVEQMMCPGGCVSGAGMQWLKTAKAPSKRLAAVAKRAAALDNADDHCTYKAANDNPTLIRLFETMNHDEQHAALHTEFTPANVSQENSI